MSNDDAGRTRKLTLRRYRIPMDVRRLKLKKLTLRALQAVHGSKNELDPTMISGCAGSCEPTCDATCGATCVATCTEPSCGATCEPTGCTC